MKYMNDKQLRLILLLVVAIIVVGSYRFGYANVNEKKEIVEASNVELETRLKELNAKVLQKEEMEVQEAIYKDKIAEILDQYGAGNTPEKSIMFLKSLSEEAGMEISSISFGTETPILSTNNIKTTDGLGIIAYTSDLVITYKTTYQGLKDAMTFINQYEERMTVDAITATYDSSTGNLSGTMTIKLYSIIGTDKRYEAPEVSGIKLGTDNIFGTSEQSIGKQKEVQAEGATGEQTEEPTDGSIEEQVEGSKGEQAEKPKGEQAEEPTEESTKEPTGTN